MQIVIGLSLCLFVALGIQTFRIGARDEQIALMKADAAEAVAKQERENREREQQMAENARKAANDYAKNAARIRASADGARTELDGLRNALAAAGPAPDSPASAAGTDDATRARFVVGQLANAAATVSAAADACEVRLAGLQEYVRGILK